MNPYLVFGVIAAALMFGYLLSVIFPVPELEEPEEEKKRKVPPVPPKPPDLRPDPIVNPGRRTRGEALMAEKGLYPQNIGSPREAGIDPTTEFIPAPIPSGFDPTIDLNPAWLIEADKGSDPIWPQDSAPVSDDFGGGDFGGGGAGDSYSDSGSSSDSPSND